MGNVLEDMKRVETLKGMDQETRQKYRNTKCFIENKAVYNILYRTVVHLLPVNRHVDFELHMVGGSYTNNQKVVVGVLQYAWGMSHDLVFSILKALTGHECEHVCSSDFDLFVLFQKRIGDHFDDFIQKGVLSPSIGDFEMDKTESKEKISQELTKAGGHKRYGAKLAAHLLNSIEDGAIEKILGNRMRGYVKHIKFMNALIWENQPVTGQNPLQEFLFSITSLCVTGLKSKDWDKFYKGTDLDELLNQVRPLVIKGINAPTPKGRAEATFEIYKVIAPKVAELLQDNMDAMDMLPQDLNFQGNGGSKQSGESGFPGNSISTHFVPEDEKDSSEEKSEDQKSQGKRKEKADQTPSSEENNKDEQKDSSNASHSSQAGQEGENGEDADSSDGKGEGNGEAGEPNSQSQTPNGNGNQEGNDETLNSSSSKGKGTNEEDMTDHSAENSKKEEALVKDFLRNAKKELEQDLENDMKQIKNEETKIQKEEERKAKESGNLSEHELKDVLKGRGVQKFIQKVVNVRPKTVPEGIVQKGKRLHRQLEKILMDKQGYTARNRKRGVLDTTGVWKLGIKEYNTFLKKGKPDDSSYVVTVLKDNSGSMNDYAVGDKRKADFANEACAILEEGLKGLVPFRIINFNDEWENGVRHQIISDFGDTDKVNRAYSAEARTGGANADSISIRVATQELLKRKETKKILLVLSDGLPSCYYNEKDAITSVQNAVRDARKAGVIVIAICFGSEKHLKKTRDSYHKMYQKGIIMTTPENIPTQIVKVLEREIK